MEEKQLNFDAPLLSIRRYIPEATSERGDKEKISKSPHKGPFPPPYKSDIKSGPVRKAGSVPFVWEQTPGKPKGGGGSCSENPKVISKVPNLPPGRKVDAQKQKQQISCAKPIRDHQFPLVSKNKTSNRNVVISLARPKGGDKQEEERSSDNDSDDAFSDALDSLSRTESFYANCSLSGFSNLDYLHLKPPRNLSLESEARDFMMGRFLPAAKAMTSKAPQFSARKPYEVRQTICNSNITNGERVSASYQNRPLAVPQHAPEDDEESEDEDYDNTGYVSARACGLIPRFCMKNSFCLLNPIAGMRDEGQMPQSYASRKLNICKKDITTRDSVSEIVNEHSKDPIHKCKLTHGIQVHQSYNFDRKPTRESNQLTSWSESQMSDGSSSSRRPNDDVLSCNQKDAPQSPCHDGPSLTIMPEQCMKTTDNECRKGRNSLRELLKFDSDSEKGSWSSSPMVEKTLYVDSVQELDRPMSINSSEEILSPKFRDVDILFENEALRRGADVERQPNIMKVVDMFQPRCSETVDHKPSPGNMYPLTPSEIVNRKPSSCSCGDVTSAQIDKREDVHSADCPNEGTGSSQGCIDVKPLVAKESRETVGYPIQSSRESVGYPIQSLPAPPLPKSPSESWLWRTLPASRNQSSCSHSNNQFCQRKQVPKTSATDPKWEKIVRTSNGHFLI